MAILNPNTATAYKPLTMNKIFSAFELADLADMHGEPDFHAKAVAYITPLMPRIDRAVGHPNDASYIAYAVEYALNRLPEFDVPL